MKTDTTSGSLKIDTGACLILLSRSPAAGPVKTRLARETTQDFAQTLYGFFLQDLAKTLMQLDVPVFVFFTPDTPLAAENLGDLLSPLCKGRPDPIFLPQGSGSLETRMDRALADCFAKGFQRVALIGGDLPDLPLAHLKAALDGLHDHDWVLGPSNDGGYYLVGSTAAAFQPGLLDWQNMPSDQIFRQTWMRLQAQQMRLLALPPWQDVDTLADLQDLLARHGPAAPDVLTGRKTNTETGLQPPKRTLAWLARQPWPHMQPL